MCKQDIIQIVSSVDKSIKRQLKLEALRKKIPLKRLYVVNVQKSRDK